MTRSDVLTLLPEETFPEFFQRVGKVMVKKPTVDPLLMTSRSLLTIALSYNNLLHKKNVPLEKTTLLKWIREVGWAGSGAPAAELTDEELDQRLKYAYTYRLAGKPSGLVDTATTIKYATGRGSYCLECCTGFERNRRCGHSELPVLNICGVDTCGVAYHSCCLDEPSDDDSLQKRGRSRTTWFCPEHAKGAPGPEQEQEIKIAAAEQPPVTGSAPPPFAREAPGPPRYGYGPPPPPPRSAPVPVPENIRSRPLAQYPPHEGNRDMRGYYPPVKSEPRSMPAAFPPLPHGAPAPDWSRQQPKRPCTDRERAYSWSEPQWPREEAPYPEDSRMSVRYHSWGENMSTSGGGSNRDSGEWGPAWEWGGSRGGRQPEQSPESDRYGDGGQCLFMLAEMAAQQEKMRCTPQAQDRDRDHAFGPGYTGTREGYSPAYSPAGPYASSVPRRDAHDTRNDMSHNTARAAVTDSSGPAFSPPGVKSEAVHIIDPNSYKACTEALEGMYGPHEPAMLPKNGHDGGRGGGNGVHAAKAAEPSYGDSMAMLSKDLGVVVTVSPVAVSPVG